MSALASFVAGTVSVVGLMLLAPPLAEFALRFGPAEYFALMVLGLTMLTRLAGKSLIKGLMMGMFGLALGTIGLDPMTGVFPVHGRPRRVPGRGRVRLGRDGPVRARRDLLER